MDPISFRNQPIPGIEVASMRPSNDQAINPPGEHTTPSEQVAPTRISTIPQDEAAEPWSCLTLTRPEARQTNRGSPVSSYILFPGLIFFRVQNIGVLFFSSYYFDQFEFTI